MKVFPTKKDAINFLENSDNNNYKLFQEDKDETNKKQFLVAEKHEIYNLIKKKRNNIYESWNSNTKLHFALDIDKKGTVEDEISYLNNIILNVMKTASEKYDHKFDYSDFYLTKSKNKDKYSVHIICVGLVFNNYKACKEFFDSIKKNIDLKDADDSIYRLTCLRTTFSTKYGKNSILNPFSITVNNKSTAKCTNKKDYFFKTLITNVDDDSQVITCKNKNIKKIEEVDKTTSSNVKLEQLLNYLPKEYYDEYPKWLKVAFICYNDNNNNYEIFDKWSKKSNNYDEKNNKKIWNSFKNEVNKKLSIGSLIYWLKINNININSIFKNIENTVNEYIERPIIINEDIKNIININQDKLNTKYIKQGMNKMLFCIQSEKGTGKTTSLIKYIFEEEHENIPNSILFVSSRRTFGIKLLADLKKYGFKLYSDIDEKYISLKKIIVQIDSLLRLTNDNFDLIIIDECESLARYMTSIHFMKNLNSSLIVNDFEYKLEKAKKVIIMDADLSDRSIKYYRNIMELENDEILLLKNNKNTYSSYKINYMKYDNWVYNISNFLEQNKKLVIPMASNNKAKDLKSFINDTHENKKVLLIHKETSDEEKLQKLLNVNTDWVNYDVVIYTPTVCMGVSFDVLDHFDNIFAYGCHESLGSQEFTQMIHRVRNPKSQIIYLSVDRYEFCNIEEDYVDYNYAEEIICSDFYLTKYEINNNLIPKKFGRDRVIKYPYKEEPIYDLYVRNCTEIINDRINFTASLFGYLKYKKYKLKYLNNNDNNNIKEIMNNISEERKENELNKLINGIMSAENLSKKDFNEKIKRKDEYMDDETIYSIKKYNIVNCYDLNNYDELNDNFVKIYHDKKLMSYYNNLKNILKHGTQSTRDKLNVLKDNEVYTLDTLSIYEEFKNRNKFINHYYPYILLKYLEIDINDINQNKNINFDLNKKIENKKLNEFIENEKKILLNKFNLRKCDIDYTDIKSVIKFINKIISKQYGLEIKNLGDGITLTDNNLWNGIQREEKIKVKKIKSIVKKERRNDVFDDDDDI